MIIFSKIITCGSIAIIFLAYSNFGPAALGSDMVAGYVKNHFVREILFGITLAIITLNLIILASSKRHIWKIILIGSVVVLPFWIAALLGWSTDGLEYVWSNQINSDAAYILHGTQVAMFYLGVLLLYQALPSKNSN